MRLRRGEASSAAVDIRLGLALIKWPIPAAVWRISDARTCSVVHILPTTYSCLALVTCLVKTSIWWHPKCTVTSSLEMPYQETFALSGFTQSITSVQFSPRCTELLAIGDEEGLVTILDFVREKILVRFLTSGPVTALAWSPFADLLVTGHKDGQVASYDLHGRKRSEVRSCLFLVMYT